jgi:hypothetical protein
MRNKPYQIYKNLTSIADSLTAFDFKPLQLLKDFLELVTFFGAVYIYLVIFSNSPDRGGYGAMALGIFIGLLAGAIITRLILVQLFDVAISMVGFFFFRKALKAEKDQVTNRIENLEVEHGEAQ